MDSNSPTKSGRVHWNSLFSAGAAIAKEGIGFVNKQISEIKESIHVRSSSDDHAHRQEEPNFSRAVDAAIHGGLSATPHQIPVFYVTPPMRCPAQCTTCRASSDLQAFDGAFFDSNSPEGAAGADGSAAGGGELNAFLLPPEIESIETLTVAQLKILLPQSILPRREVRRRGRYFDSQDPSSVIHLRFKVVPPVEDQDLFPDYIWLDVGDEQLAPTYLGFIHVSIVPLPPVKLPKGRQSKLLFNNGLANKRSS